MSAVPSSTGSTTLEVTNWNGTHAGTVVLVPVTGKDWQVQSDGSVVGAVRWDAAGQEWTGTASHTYPRTGGPVVADPDLNYVLGDLLEQFRGLRSSEFWIDVPAVPGPTGPAVPSPTTETTLLEIDVDPDSSRCVQGKILRIDLEGCDCGTCQSQPFVQISNGSVLYSVLLTDEDVRSLRTNGYLTVVPD